MANCKSNESDSSVKALSTVEVDISKVDKGKEITVMWRGKPVFIKRRTEDEITKARNISLGELPHPENRQKRGIKRRMVSCSWYLYTFRMCSNKRQRGIWWLVLSLSRFAL